MYELSPLHCRARSGLIAFRRATETSFLSGCNRATGWRQFLTIQLLHQSIHVLVCSRISRGLESPSSKAPPRIARPSFVIDALHHASRTDGVITYLFHGVTGQEDSCRSTGQRFATVAHESL